MRTVLILIGLVTVLSWGVKGMKATYNFVVSRQKISAAKEAAEDKKLYEELKEVCRAEVDEELGAYSTASNEERSRKVEACIYYKGYSKGLHRSWW